MFGDCSIPGSGGTRLSRGEDVRDGAEVRQEARVTASAEGRALAGEIGAPPSPSPSCKESYFAKQPVGSRAETACDRIGQTFFPPDTDRLSPQRVAPGEGGQAGAGAACPGSSLGGPDTPPRERKWETGPGAGAPAGQRWPPRWASGASSSRRRFDSSSRAGGAGARMRCQAQGGGHFVDS